MTVTIINPDIRWGFTPEGLRMRPVLPMREQESRREEMANVEPIEIVAVSEEAVREPRD
jgi:hypothetical protein